MNAQLFVEKLLLNKLITKDFKSVPRPLHQIVFLTENYAIGKKFRPTFSDSVKVPEQYQGIYRINRVRKSARLMDSLIEAERTHKQKSELVVIDQKVSFMADWTEVVE